MDSITYSQATLFVTYVGYIWARFGVLSSISASTYAYHSRNNRYLFFFWLLSIGILNYWQDMALWGFLMSIGFVAAGLTIDHRAGPTLEDEIHTWSTVLAITSGFLGLIFLYGIWPPTVAFIAGGGLLYWKAPNKIWWIEIWAFACIMVGLLSR